MKEKIMGILALFGIGGWILSALIKSMSMLVWLWVGLILFNANAHELEMSAIFIEQTVWNFIFVFLIAYKLWATSGIITTKIKFRKGELRK